jgi:hypothetical protein
MGTKSGIHGQICRIGSVAIWQRAMIVNFIVQNRSPLVCFFMMNLSLVYTEERLISHERKQFMISVGC